uniref:MAGE domain-containing protein n=1 Tax=Meloidogyne javanica TaxID=6303 RepID=A0A915N1Z4_MELJA
MADDINEDIDQDEEMDYSDDQDDREMLNRLKLDLVKKVVQCVMSCCTKRGYCRDGDIADVFTDRKERRLKDKVLKIVRDEFMNVFGMKLKRDDDSKRYYLYNGLGSNLAMDVSQWYDKRCGPLSKSLASDVRSLNSNSTNNNASDDEDQENEKLVENRDFKRWLLTSTLMFIFMSKRHQSKGNANEKGIDFLLIKEFLNKMFDKFNTEHLTDKQYMDIFGPSKSAEFISQGWLKGNIQFDQASGADDIFYHWGPRAETVVSKKEILEEFVRIYGGTINDWPNHAKAAGVRIEKN